MGILSRMLRLCRADVHGVMDQLEDKGLLLKQYLREMEASLEQKENRLDQIAQNCVQIESDLSNQDAEVQKLEKDLALAIRKEKDDIARMLIRKQRHLQGVCEQFTKQIDHMTQEKNQLTEILAKQKLQYVQLKTKTAAFCQQTEQQAFELAFGPTNVSASWSAPTDEEIELELLQRKDALRKGGAT